MRHAVTVVLDFLWLAFGYYALLGIGRHFLTGRYRSEAATIAVLVAFSAGVSLHRTLPLPAAVPEPAVASVAPATATALPVKDVSSDVGGACRSARLGSAVGKGNVDGATVQAAGSAVPIALRVILRNDDTLVVSGWAATPQLNAPSRAVCLVVDGKILSGIRVIYGEHRPDVAKAFKTTVLDPTGFEAAVPVGRLGAGLHTLQAAAVAEDGSGSLLPGSVRVAGPPRQAR